MSRNNYIPVITDNYTDTREVSWDCINCGIDITEKLEGTDAYREDEIYHACKKCGQKMAVEIEIDEEE